MMEGKTMPDNEAEISPVNRPKEQARISYDKMYAWYEWISGGCEKKFRNAGESLLGVHEGEIVLEIGFGAGFSLLTFANSVGISGKVYGIDISDRMLDYAQKRLDRADLSDRVHLCCGDAAELPYNANFFNAIYMSFTLELFDTPNIPVVLAECKRVLVKGGRLCVVAMSKKGKPTALMKFYERAHRKYPKYIDCRPIFVEKTHAEAGFIILESVEMSMHTLPVAIVLVKS